MGGTSSNIESLESLGAKGSNGYMTDGFMEIGMGIGAIIGGGGIKGDGGGVILCFLLGTGELGILSNVSFSGMDA